MALSEQQRKQLAKGYPFDIGTHAELGTLDSEGFKGELSLEKLCKPDIMGRNCYHIAAKGGQLQNFPRRFFDQKGFMAISKKSENILHLAKDEKQINIILQFLPEKKIEILLSQPNSDGYTPLHIQSQKAILNAFPNKFLTKKALKIQSPRGNVLETGIIGKTILYISVEIIARNWELIGEETREHIQNLTKKEFIEIQKICKRNVRARRALKQEFNI